jgi:hypothetical protein
LSRPAVELLQRSQPSKLTCANRRVYESRRNAHARLCRFLSRGCCRAWFPNANLLNNSTRSQTMGRVKLYVTHGRGRNSQTHHLMPSL